MSFLSDERSGAPAGAQLEAQPLYQQTRNLLVRRIIDGVWKPGSYLPSEQQLGADLGVSVGTIRKATEDLVDQGVLERQHGRGTRVVAHSSAQSRFRFLRFVHPDGRTPEPVARLLAQRVQKASALERAQLELGPQDRVLSLTRTRSEGGETLIFERIALPAEPFRNLKLTTGEDMVEEVYVLYQKQCGVTIMRTVDEVSLDTADEEMARHLSVEAATPLLKVTRVAFSLDGRRNEFRESWTAKLRYRTALD